MDLFDLKEKCVEKGFELNENQLKQFDKYTNLLIEWNKKINLTAITEYNEIVEKHFLDSIIPLLDEKLCGKLCDVGSGAGFPSIPMKIVDPSLEVVILEPINKRCVFLNEVISQLNLDNITVYNVRSEDFVKKNREIFDIVIARAVANLSILAELCIPLVKMDSYFIAMKGEKGIQESVDATNATNILGCKLIKANEFMLNEFKRVNLVYKKIKKTPLKYPRNYSRIKKQPL